MKKFAAILLLGALLVSACTTKRVGGGSDLPDKLIFGVVAGADPGTRKKMMDPICDYLSKKIGIPVSFIVVADYTALIEALRAKKVHMADIPPYAYVIASRNIELSPLIVLGANGKPSFYRSMIIASKKSLLSNMAEVRARAKDLTLCFAEPASASGHLIPKAYLVSVGLEPQTAFKEVIFGGGHQTTVYAVKSGKADLGCVTQVVLNLMIKMGGIRPDEFTTVWTSDPIVAQPIVVRKDLDQALAKRIQSAYLDMRKDAPETLNNYLSVYRKDFDSLSYQVAYDSMYDGLRKIAAGIKELN